MGKFLKNEQEPKNFENLPNITDTDLIANAVELAQLVSDYDLFRQDLQRRFGLGPQKLDWVIEEAMKVLSEFPDGEQGTPNNPTNTPGGRPIDVKQGADRTEIGKSRMAKVKMGNDVLYVKLGDKEAPAIAKTEAVQFVKAWEGAKAAGFGAYKGRGPERTATPFTKFWNKEVQKQKVLSNREKAYLVDDVLDKFFGKNAMEKDMDDATIVARAVQYLKSKGANDADVKQIFGVIKQELGME